MIRRIQVENFVHFHTEQTLYFEKGSYFFIGENESGKSCMFEAVRRCMSTSKNPGISSIHDSNQDSFVICKFDLSEESLVITSGIARFHSQETIVKFVCSQKTPDGTPILYMDLVKKEKGSWEVNEGFNLSQLDKECKDFTNHCFTDNFKSKDFFASLRRIVSEEKLIKFSKIDCKYDPGTECEKYLSQHIDSKVVITYPVRSIATVQWTNSFNTDGTRESKRRKVKDDLRERTEIISWYYGPEGTKRSDEEKTRVAQYFGKITNNSSLVFEMLKNENKLVAYENERKERPMSLEKVPEGYFEAMNCSILLAINDFKTVCVEELGRGMHPQMIERMRDLVLQTINDKVIISTSHIPTFLAEWNIPRVYFFRRRLQKNPGEGRVLFEVVCGNDIQNQKVQRMLTNQEYATLLFAARVLFVEGESDRLFLSAMKSIMQTEESITRDLIKDFLPELDIQTFMEFMRSLHFISIDGHLNKGKFRDVCRVLDLKHYFLLDYDVLKSMEKDHHFWKSVFSEINETEVTDDKNAETKYSEMDFEQDVTLLEKNGIFVWRKTNEYKAPSDGKIEGALVSLVDKMEDKTGVKKFFKDNHSELGWICSDENAKLKGTEKPGKKNYIKLFREGQLTEENMKNVARKVLECCRQSKDADVSRLLRFLFKASQSVD